MGGGRGGIEGLDFAMDVITFGCFYIFACTVLSKALLFSREIENVRELQAGVYLLWRKTRP
ncbi:hypothetical protein HOY82DRAFT_527204, partial [Tuber indicum]